MKKIISLILSFAMLLGVLVALGSCGEPDDPGAKIAVYLGEEIYDFDPSEYYVNDNAAQVMSLLFEPLFTIDEDGDRKKAVADDYEIDEEKRTITIELRETYWSDNVRVSADDFMFAWRNILLNPNNANPAAALLYDIENAVNVKNGRGSVYDLGLEKISAYSFEITYRNGADPEKLLDNLASIATSPIRQDKYEGAEGFWSKKNDAMVFNGPFKVVGLDYDQTVNASFKLERNVGYHQSYNKKDYDNKVRPYMLYALYSAEGNKMQCSYDQLVNNTIFYMCDAPLSDRRLYSEEATVADALSTYSYVFNTENPLFDVKEVRQALSMAIDRDAIVNEITFGKAAEGFVPAAVENFRDGYSYITTSSKLAAAKALIDSDYVQNKIKDLDKSFVLTVNDDEESLVIANMVKAAWELLGFNVQIEALGAMINTVTVNGSNTTNVYDSWIQYIVKSKALGNADSYDPDYVVSPGRISSNADDKDGIYTNFDVIAVDWQFYTDDAFVGLASLSTAFSGGGFDYVSSSQRVNISGWTDIQYDAYITEAYKATDEAARNAALHKAEQILLDAMPIMPIVSNQNFSFSSKELKKVELDGFGNFVFTDAKLKDYQKYYNRY